MPAGESDAVRLRADADRLWRAMLILAKPHLRKWLTELRALEYAADAAFSAEQRAAAAAALEAERQKHRGKQ